MVAERRVIAVKDVDLRVASILIDVRAKYIDERSRRRSGLGSDVGVFHIVRDEPPRVVARVCAVESTKAQALVQAHLRQRVVRA